MIAITSDIDWAPDPVIRFMVEMLEEHEIKCTFFCTHTSEIIEEIIKKPLFEVALHPNFNGLMDRTEQGTAAEIIEELKNKFPSAKGIRSHSLTMSSRLLQMFKGLDFAYESNYLVPYQFSHQPWKCWTGITRIPIHWEDDIEFTINGKVTQFQPPPAKERFCIYNFHPIHVFLHTRNASHYENAKIHYQDAEALEKERELTEYNIHSFFRDLLGQMKSSGECGITLSEISDIIQNEKG